MLSISATITERVAQITREMASAEAELKELRDTMNLLKRMPHTRHDLAIFGTDKIASFLVEGRDLQKFNSEAHKEIKECVILKGEYSTIASISRDSEKEFGNYVRSMKLSVEAIPKMSGPVSANEKLIESKISESESKHEAILHLEA